MSASASLLCDLTFMMLVCITPCIFHFPVFSVVIFSYMYPLLLITESTDFSLIDKTMECAEGHCSLVWHQNPEMGSNEVQILCYLSRFFWYLYFTSLFIFLIFFYFYSLHFLHKYLYFLLTFSNMVAISITPKRRTLCGI